MTKPTPEQLAAAKARLEYFQGRLAEVRSWTEGHEMYEHKEGHTKYYEHEVAERLMLWALWEHLLAP